MSPLEGLLVLDFSTLLPGPLATLILAEAGARVVKVERPEGDPMRAYAPSIDGESVNFALLNRGKESLALDLSQPAGRAALRPWLEKADVLVEQFRPGVMGRLGLAYETVREINPRLVYCSITGYGQDGPLAQRAGHDLNYMAETGCLALAQDPQHGPTLPPVLAADIAGGAYPAVMSISLALLERARTGRGTHLDISMTANLFTLQYWALGEGLGAGRWPRPNEGLVTGGSPRYRLYRTADGRHLAVAALEDKFWNAFCDAIGLPKDFRNGRSTQEKVDGLIGSKSASHWEAALAGLDTCCSVVVSPEEAVAHPHFHALFQGTVRRGNRAMPALPVPIAPVLRSAATAASFPRLGEHQ
jgi:crotonobetainyl-CoA:carnitine CoA-transferase CaiB-like acyl-CoA transferase